MITVAGSLLKPEAFRRITYRMPRTMLIEFLRGERSLPLPADVTIVNVSPDHTVVLGSFQEEDHVLLITLEHTSFEEVVFRVPVLDLIEKKPVQVEVLPARKATA